MQEWHNNLRQLVPNEYNEQLWYKRAPRVLLVTTTLLDTPESYKSAKLQNIAVQQWVQSSVAQHGAVPCRLAQYYT